jgi:hypothetical protein
VDWIHSAQVLLQWTVGLSQVPPDGEIIPQII